MQWHEIKHTHRIITLYTERFATPMTHFGVSVNPLGFGVIIMCSIYRLPLVYELRNSTIIILIQYNTHIFRIRLSREVESYNINYVSLNLLSKPDIIYLIWKECVNNSGCTQIPDAYDNIFIIFFFVFIISHQVIFHFVVQFLIFRIYYHIIIRQSLPT